MIIDLMLDVISTLLGWILTLLPTWDVHLPSGLTGLIASALAFDDILPIREGLICLGLSAGLSGGFTIFKWGVKVVDYIADIIP